MKIPWAWEERQHQRLLGPQLQLEREFQLGGGQLQLGELLQLHLGLLCGQLQREQDAQPQLCVQRLLWLCIQQEAWIFQQHLSSPSSRLLRLKDLYIVQLYEYRKLISYQEERRRYNYLRLGGCQKDHPPEYLSPCERNPQVLCETLEKQSEGES